MGKGNIYLWTGNGAGKSSSALGVALRTVAHNKKVVVIQFLIARKFLGEYKIRKRLGHNYKIYQFGRNAWINPNNLNEVDRKIAHNGLEFAKEVVQKEKPFLLVLDEINLALSFGLLNTREVINFLRKVPRSTRVYLIGRNAPYELRNFADYVNEIVLVKRPKGWKPTKGIEF